MARNRIEVRICHRRKLIRDRRLLQQTETGAREAVTDVVGTRRPPREQLAEEQSGANDRPGQQLREKRQIERVVERLSHGGRAPAVDVDEIRNALKRVEADADRDEEIDEPRVGCMPINAATVPLPKLAYLKLPRTQDSPQRPDRAAFACRAGRSARLDPNPNRKVARRKIHKRARTTRSSGHKNSSWQSAKRCARSAAEASKKAPRRLRRRARTRTTETAAESRFRKPPQTTKASDARAADAAADRRASRRGVCRPSG